MVRKLLAILLCLCQPSWATWAVVNSAINAACTGTSCAITVTSTGAGHLLLIIAGMTGTAGSSISSVTSGCTSAWIHCPNCNGLDTTAGGTDAYYCLNSAAGVTTITMTTASTGGFNSGAEVEFSSSIGNFYYDTSGNRDQSTAGTSVAGVTLAPSGKNDVVIQAATCTSNTTAVTPIPPWGAPFVDPNGNGVTGSTNTVSGVAPTWTQASGTDALMAIAFAEPFNCQSSFCGMIGGSQ